MRLATAREMCWQTPDLTHLIYNDSTLFAAAQNQAARLAKGNWLLSLNPDVVSVEILSPKRGVRNLDPKTGGLRQAFAWKPSENQNYPNHRPMGLFLAQPASS